MIDEIFLKSCDKSIDKVLHFGCKSLAVALPRQGRENITENKKSVELIVNIQLGGSINLKQYFPQVSKNF